MNHSPKNTTVFTPSGRAELFWQTVNCDHFAENHSADAGKAGKSRFHDLRFKDIAHLLSGDVAIDPVGSKGTKWRAISFYKEKHYLTIFHLQKRDDCDTLFAVVVTCYATYHERHRKEYEKYIRGAKKG